MLAVNDWLLLIGVCALGEMTPGASLAVVTRHTLRGSARAGVSAGLAHAAGIGVYAVATVAGLAVVLRGFPQLESPSGWPAHCFCCGWHWAAGAPPRARRRIRTPGPAATRCATAF